MYFRESINSDSEDSTFWTLKVFFGHEICFLNVYISPYLLVNQWFLYIFVDNEWTEIEDNVLLSTEENSDGDNFEVEDEVLLSTEENSDHDNFEVEDEVLLSTEENSDHDNFEVEDEVLLSAKENSDDDNIEVEEEHHCVPPEDPELEEPENGDDPLLYEGARITLGESLMNILTFVLTYSLSGVALSALLKLIIIHCPVQNFCKKSMYSFYKHFQSLNTPPIRQYCCYLCFRILNSEKSICKNCQQLGVAYFIEIPILSKLQKLYKRPGFFNS